MTAESSSVIKLYDRRPATVSLRLLRAELSDILGDQFKDCMEVADQPGQLVIWHRGYLPEATKNLIKHVHMPLGIDAEFYRVRDKNEDLLLKLYDRREVAMGVALGVATAGAVITVLGLTDLMAFEHTRVALVAICLVVGYNVYRGIKAQCEIKKHESS